MEISTVISKKDGKECCQHSNFESLYLHGLKLVSLLRFHSWKFEVAKHEKNSF